MASKGARWDAIPESMKSRIKGSDNATAMEPSRTDPKEKMQALGRLPTGTMNKTEAAYARRLDAMKYCGDIVWWAFEPINIRLAKNCYYRVDFLVMLNTGAIEAHEVKGFWTDDARAKITIAASLLPFPFIAARIIKGQWEFEYF